MPYPLAGISADAGLPWPRPRDSDQLELYLAPPAVRPGRIPLEIAPLQPRVVQVTPEPEQPVDPAVDTIAMLVVMIRALNRFAVAVEQRVRFYESGGRRRP